jgi:hypothetical protein
MCSLGMPATNDKLLQEAVNNDTESYVMMDS